MSRETSYAAIILKKQSIGEGDELITVYTRDRGKLRVMGKSTKLAKSRLQYSLQALFYVEMTVTTGSLPKVIGVEVKNTFANIRENLSAARMAIYAVELVLKFSPDEERNEALFDLLVSFFVFLNGIHDYSQLLPFGLEKFKINFLETIGLTITYTYEQPPVYFGFSNSRGGFVFEQAAADVIPVSEVSYQLFLHLKQSSFGEFTEAVLNPAIINKNPAELSAFISGFLRYQLERDIKSEQFLNMV